jgi:UDP-N-acetylglucosamine 3-dehydrogenase
VTIRVGVVGCGTIARRVHIPGLQAAGAELTAFTSRTRASAEEAARECGGGTVLDTWSELVVRSDVDLVDVCTPNALHADIAVAAAEAGKHVLVEKPMARTVAEADRMIAAARASGVALVPAQNSRFLAPFVAMREAVARGDVGEVRAVRCAWGHGGPEGWASGAKWFRQREASGGGALIDLGVHAADLLRSVLGDELVEVAAMTSPGATGDVEDLAQVVMRFAGGAIGTLQASWAVADGNDNQLTIQGTRGTLHLDHRSLPILSTGQGAPTRLTMPDPCPTLFDLVIAALNAGTALPITAQDGRAAVALVEAAYRSSASGRVERVDGAA